MKVAVALAFGIILSSLAFALFHMMRKSGDEKDRARRMARSLTVRIGMSVLLFLAILIAAALGLIHPTGRI